MILLQPMKGSSLRALARSMMSSVRLFMSPYHILRSKTFVADKAAIKVLFLFLSYRKLLAT